MAIVKPIDFYSMGLDARLALVKAAQEERRTLISRWEALPFEATDGWSPRAQAAAGMLGGMAAVLDLGCGMMALERYLAPGVRYLPVDVVRRDDRTLVIDLNREELPLGLEVAGVAALGLVEYLYDVPKFLGQIARIGSDVVVSYNTTDHFPDVDLRTGHAWVNHLALDDMERLFEDNGLLVVEAVQLDLTQTLWKLRSRIRNPHR